MKAFRLYLSGKGSRLVLGTSIQAVAMALQGEEITLVQDLGQVGLVVDPKTLDVTPGAFLRVPGH